MMQHVSCHVCKSAGLLKMHLHNGQEGLAGSVQASHTCVFDTCHLIIHAMKYLMYMGVVVVKLQW
jgi:hypothetical protein